MSPQFSGQALQAADLPPSTKKKCLRLLYRTCGYHTLLPSALRILVDYDRTSDALYRGGYADVWKGEYRGQDVAVKVIRTYSNRELQRVVNVSDRLSSPLRTSHFVLITPFPEVLQGCCDVEIPSTSECPTTSRSNNAGDSIHNDIGLDGERRYQ